MLDMLFLGLFLGACFGMAIGIFYMSWWSRIPLRTPRPKYKYTSLSNEEAWAKDAAAIGGDWKRVGDDLRRAADKLHNTAEKLKKPKDI